MANEQTIMRLNILQQQAEKLEEQVNVANQQIQELEELRINLTGISEGEILANIGNGIFIKAEVKSKELYLNIGEKTIVKKDIKGAQEIIKNQIDKIMDFKSNVLSEIEKINLHLRELLLEAQSKPK